MHKKGIIYFCSWSIEQHNIIMLYYLTTNTNYLLQKNCGLTIALIAIRPFSSQHLTENIYYWLEKWPNIRKHLSDHNRRYLCFKWHIDGWVVQVVICSAVQCSFVFLVAGSVANQTWLLSSLPLGQLSRVCAICWLPK